MIRKLYVFGVPVLALALVSAIGCGSRAKPCPVSGTILVNGQPAGGLYVVFHATGNPQRKQSPSAARTQDDGSYSARVPGPGEYAVTVFWPSVTEEDGEVVEGDDQFGGKYRNPEQPVLNTTIQAGENLLAPITLAYP